MDTDGVVVVRNRLTLALTVAGYVMVSPGAKTARHFEYDITLVGTIEKQRFRV
jgi:hypothetical protein